MDLKELKEKVKKWGIKSNRKMNEIDLVRLIQAAEGNFPCFGTAKEFCDQASCSWRGDCLFK
ncbi:MAG: SAP domain-containing protein [Candidatus Omnitrophota bacterium]